MLPSREFWYTDTKSAASEGKLAFGGAESGLYGWKPESVTLASMAETTDLGDVYVDSPPECVDVAAKLKAWE
jgi:hypothetical protein